MVIRNVAVIGAGLMGTGITQVVAQAGFHVFWVDVSYQQLEKGLADIDRILNRGADKGKYDSSHVVASLERLQVFTELTALAAQDIDLVIEAVPEKIELKKEIFQQLDRITVADTILASNTSGLSISAMAAVTSRPERVLGMHFFYPAPLMDLVEITPGLLTLRETFNEIAEFARAIGKTPVECKDYPGFVVNRILVPMINEAIYLVMEGIIPEDVDEAMKLGANHPMGPIALADFVGLDTLLATMRGLYYGFNDTKYRPCPLLVKMVESGNLGRKTGRGFYQYNLKS